MPAAARRPPRGPGSGTGAKSLGQELAYLPFYFATIAAVWAGTPPRSARSQIAICVSRLRAALSAKGYEAGDGSGYDSALRDALWAYIGTENLEERWTEEPTIERGILTHILG